MLTYDLLLREVWRGESGNVKLVRAMVKKLRRKLGDDAGQPGYILTERGVGYKIGPTGRLENAQCAVMAIRFTHLQEGVLAMSQETDRGRDERARIVAGRRSKASSRRSAPVQGAP